MLLRGFTIEIYLGLETLLFVRSYKKMVIDFTTLTDFDIAVSLTGLAS